MALHSKNRFIEFVEMFPNINWRDKKIGLTKKQKKVLEARLQRQTLHSIGNSKSRQSVSHIETYALYKLYKYIIYEILPKIIPTNKLVLDKKK